MPRLLVLAIGCLSALVVVTGASATSRRAANIEPWDRVGGMLVVQRAASRADTALFGIYCRPDIVRSGRYRRTCSAVPRVARLFVGYGMFAPATAVTRAWSATTWKMWIDGHRVGLDRFGTTDRTLHRYPPAGGRDVTLREWSVALVQPTPGRHTVRYHMRTLGLDIDATWEFTIARGSRG